MRYENEWSPADCENVGVMSTGLPAKSVFADWIIAFGYLPVQIFITKDRLSVLRHWGYFYRVVRFVVEPVTVRKIGMSGKEQYLRRNVLRQYLTVRRQAAVVRGCFSAAIQISRFGEFWKRYSLRNRKSRLSGIQHYGQHRKFSRFCGKSLTFGLSTSNLETTNVPVRSPVFPITSK